MRTLSYHVHQIGNSGCRLEPFVARDPAQACRRVAAMDPRGRMTPARASGAVGQAEQLQRAVSRRAAGEKGVALFEGLERHGRLVRVVDPGFPARSSCLASSSICAVRSRTTLCPMTLAAARARLSGSGSTACSARTAAMNTPMRTCRPNRSAGQRHARGDPRRRRGGARQAHSQAEQRSQVEEQADARRLDDRPQLAPRGARVAPPARRKTRPTKAYIRLARVRSRTPARSGRAYAARRYAARRAAPHARWSAA